MPVVLTMVLTVVWWSDLGVDRAVVAVDDAALPLLPLRQMQMKPMPLRLVPRCS